MADPIIFIDTEIEALLTYSEEVQAMDVGTLGDNTKEFEDAITDVMYRIEGVSHFMIENFYTFDYLEKYDALFKPTVD